MFGTKSGKKVAGKIRPRGVQGSIELNINSSLCLGKNSHYIPVLQSCYGLILKIITTLQILKLEVEKVAAQRSFLFLWCGSHEGLNEGRKVITCVH